MSPDPLLTQIGTMTWHAITPEETLRILTVIDSLPWPLPEPAAIRLLVERLGWSVNDEGFVDNNLSGLNWGDVSVNDDGEETSDVGFDISDLERERHDNPEWLTWRDDHFTLTVRHLAETWGNPRLDDSDPDFLRALWDLPSGGRVKIVKSDMAVDAGYVTPQMAEIERGRGY